MMMNNEFTSCEGTNEICIESKEGGDSDLVDRKGIIAVWKRHREGTLEDEISFLDGIPTETAWDLQILATDQEKVYSCKLDLQNEDSASNADAIKTDIDLDAVISSMLARNPTQKAMYTYLLQSYNSAVGENSMQMKIEGLNFTCVLKSIASEVSDSSNNTTACMIMMINSLHSSSKDNEKLLSQMSKWKFTATQLDDKWQKVQGQLLENFLTLYKKVKDELHSCRLELEEEKKKEKISNIGKTHSSTTRNNAYDGKALDYDDDEDFVDFDPEEIERLASGPIKGKLPSEQPYPPKVVSIKTESTKDPYIESVKQATVKIEEKDVDVKRPNCYESQDNVAIESQPKKARVFIALNDDSDSSESEMVLL